MIENTMGLLANTNPVLNYTYKVNTLNMQNVQTSSNSISVDAPMTETNESVAEQTGNYVQNEVQVNDGNRVSEMAKSYQQLLSSERVHGYRHTGMLMNILEGCHSFNLQMQLKHQETTLKAQLNAYYKQVRPEDDKPEKRHMLTKLVRCVFQDAEHQLINTYKTILAFADKSKVPAQGLSAFIAKHEGIQKCKLAAHAANQGKAPKTDVERVAEVKKTFEIYALAEIPAEVNLTGDLQIDVGTTIVLLATKTQKGALAINGVVNNEAAIKATLVCFHKANKNIVEGALEKSKQAEKRAAIEAAAA